MCYIDISSMSKSKLQGLDWNPSYMKSIINVMYGGVSLYKFNFWHFIESVEYGYESEDNL